LVFLGREIGEQRNYSEETQRARLDLVAKTLIEQETLDSAQFKALMAA
jgi:ATP-dependent Zn protease